MATILVVDDEEICRTYLPLFLREDGHEVRAAASGEEAIAIGEGFLPDVLISDYLLDDAYDGLDVARNLQGKRDDMQIILMTGLPASQLKERLTGLHDVTILEKPLDLDQMLAEIRKLLGTSA